MKTIPLTQGYEAVVDDEDYESLMRYKWSLSHNGRPPFYAAKSIKRNGKWRHIKMHRFLLGDPVGMEVDHVNGDGLDNRRSNLRICTRFQNKWNSGMRVNNTSGFKGVHLITYRKYKKPWLAEIWKMGKGVRLGQFATAIEAAQAYNAAAQELHGEFARLNVINKEAL